MARRRPGTGPKLTNEESEALDRACGLAYATSRAGAACGAPWQEAWDGARKLIRKHGVLPSLHDALRAMQPAMISHGSDKNARIAIDRALYFESHLPIDLASCAAGVIKRDLREMDAPRAKAWRKLLAHGMAGQQAEPKAPWTRKTASLIETLGHDEVRARVVQWLNEISSREQVALSAAGADATRTLVWLVVQLQLVDAETAVFTLAARDWKRGSSWSPRHDRFVGALAYTVGHTRSRGAEAHVIITGLEPRFLRTTARYAIAAALAKLPRPFSA